MRNQVTQKLAARSQKLREKRPKENFLSAFTRDQRSSGGLSALVRLSELNIGFRAAMAGAAAQIQVVGFSRGTGIGCA